MSAGTWGGRNEGLSGDESKGVGKPASGHHRGRGNPVRFFACMSLFNTLPAQYF